MSEKKTLIIFGAGAECCFGICNGMDFAHKVVGIKTTEMEEMDEVIAEYYKGKLKKTSGQLKVWYPDEFKDVPFSDERLQVRFLEACIKKKWLDDGDSTDSKGTKIDYEEKTKKKMEELENNKDEINRIENDYTSYMDLIDEYFHTLIAPRMLGPQKFCSVVAYYTRAYLTIVQGLLKENKEGNEEGGSQKKYESILDRPKEVLYDINSAIDHSARYDIQSYYSILKKYKEKCSVITTNYTPLCEKIAGLEECDIAYVHGKIGWFESAYRRRVYDVRNDELPEDDLLFPYLFIQSGVKPIIEEKQLNEYGKALNFLQNAERIIVVGYRVNADDNHLNAILSNALYKGDKTFCYLDFENSGAEKILQRLRLDRDEIKGYIYKTINNGNCLDEFEKLLEQ